MKISPTKIFILPPGNAAPLPAANIGHLPLLWLLAPLIPALSLCLAFDLHAPRLGTALLVGLGLPALFLKNKKFLWPLCHCAAVTGLALVLFAALVPPLPDWEKLPAREAELTLCWKKRFAGTNPESKNITGIARVIDAPPHLRQLVGNDLYCQMRKPLPAPANQRGATFRAIGILDTARNFSDKPDAGFVRYLEHRRATMAFTRGRLLEEISPPNALLRRSAAQRDKLEHALRRGLETHPAAGDLLVAMILGNLSALPKETVADFQRTGTVHLFAVSGLHIGVIAAGLFWLGKRIRIPDTPWRIAVVGIILAFVLAAGAAPSAMRAWLMVACILGAQLFSRRSSPAAGLVLAAAIVVLLDPRTLLDIGFQFSYAVVAAILLYALPLAERINARWQPWRDLPEKSFGLRRRTLAKCKTWLVDSLAVGLASTLASAPIAVAHFQIFSAGGILVNIALVPLSFPVMLAGFASVALGTAGLDFLAVPLNWLSGRLLAFIADIAHLASQLPGMAWTVNYRAAWLGTLVTFALLGVLLAMNSRRKEPPVFWYFIPPAIIIISLFFV